MDKVGALLGGLVLLGFAVDGIIRKIEKSFKTFPWCKTCGLNMHAVELPRLMPGEVSNHLDKYGLPTIAASRFVCPKGHYHLWYIPGFGNTEKPFFFREEM